MLCRECGSDMTTTVEDHPYEEVDLAHVLLRSATVHRCNCGVYALEMEDPNRAHRSICCLLLSKSEPLLPAEVRFIKSVADDCAIVGFPMATVGEC